MRTNSTCTSPISVGTILPKNQVFVEKFNWFGTWSVQHGQWQYWIPLFFPIEAAMFFMLYFHFSFDVRCDNLSWNCCPPHGFSHCAISSTHCTQTKNLPTAMPLKGSKWSKGSRLSKVWPRPKRGAQSTLKELRWNHGIKWNDSNRKVGLSLGEVEESQTFLGIYYMKIESPNLHSFGMWIEVWYLCLQPHVNSLPRRLVLHRWIIWSRAAAKKGKSIERFHVHHETLLVQFFCCFFVWKRHETACHSWNRRPHCRQCQEELLPTKWS